MPSLLPHPGRGPLTEESLLQGVQELAARDPDLARLAALYGPPPLWARQPGFPTLLHIILEQQVSLASARAAFNRLEAAISPVTPDNFMRLSDEELKAVGFSRQKTRYGRELALAILTGALDLDGLDALEDEAVRARLTSVKGIGAWTADIYLLMAMLRPDVWPKGDLALEVSFQKLKGLEKRPAPEELKEYSAVWRPWRAAAARMLWHAYLGERGQAS